MDEDCAYGESLDKGVLDEDDEDEDGSTYCENVDDMRMSMGVLTVRLLVTMMRVLAMRIMMGEFIVCVDDEGEGEGEDDDVSTCNVRNEEEDGSTYHENVDDEGEDEGNDRACNKSVDDESTLTVLFHKKTCKKLLYSISLSFAFNNSN